MKLSSMLNLIALAAIISVSSCSKDDNTPSNYLPSVKGSWKFVKGAADQKYLLIYDNRTFSLFTTADAGIRGRTDGVVLVTNNQLVLNYDLESYGSSFIYNYAMAGDTLKLTSPTNSLKLVKDKSAPDTATWIKNVTSTYSIKAPINSSTDIAFDGTYLWYGNANSTDYLYKINPNTGVKDSIATNQSAWGIEYDGTNLWVSNDGYSTIQKVNITTGSVLTTSVSMGAWIYGIARDANYLWCYSGNENTLYKYNTSTNSVVTTIEINADIRGMAFSNGYLYVVANGFLHKCSLNPINTEASYALPGYSITGVTFDGTSFWVSAYETQTDSYKILKLSGVQ